MKCTHSYVTNYKPVYRNYKKWKAAKLITSAAVFCNVNQAAFPVKAKKKNAKRECIKQILFTGLSQIFAVPLGILQASHHLPKDVGTP
jgi:hypothetical protein